jgi:predicted GNAT family N-acyltransferase
MEQISILKIDTNHTLFAAVFELREKVLRKPLKLSLYNEDTSDDNQDAIWLALAKEKVIACLMLKDLGNGLLKLRQMAVDDMWQGQGIGKLLIQSAEREAIQSAYTKIQLHARQHAVGFYESLGYTAFGTIFYEVGIPHLAMEKII